MSEHRERLVLAEERAGNDVLRAIDQLRRDLTGYHGQLKAHNDLQAHCDRQRERIKELEGLYAKAKAENAELRELVRDMRVVIWAYDEATSDDDCHPALPLFEDRLRELGIEVEE